MFTNEELILIRKAIIHSANIYATFYESGDKDYPYDEVKPYVDRINVIVRKIDDQ